VCLIRARQFAEAETALLSARQSLASLSDDHAWRRQADDRLSDLYRRWGRPDEARKYRSR
jgi:hypothetical protein